MMWMLDTNICSYVIRRHPLGVKAQFDRAGADNLAISTIVLAELMFGAVRHPARADTIQADIRDFSSRLAVVSWSEAAANIYAGLRADLERKGTPIGNMDLLIAAHALAENATLVSNNTREFERVAGLQLENWA